LLKLSAATSIWTCAVPHRLSVKRVETISARRDAGVEELVDGLLAELLHRPKPDGVRRRHHV
jgi:hypothetical protein